MGQDDCIPADVLIPATAAYGALEDARWVGDSVMEYAACLFFFLIFTKRGAVVDEEP